MQPIQSAMVYFSFTRHADTAVLETGPYKIRLIFFERVEYFHSSCLRNIRITEPVKQNKELVAEHIKVALLMYKW